MPGHANMALGHIKSWPEDTVIRPSKCRRSSRPCQINSEANDALQRPG